MRIAAIPILRRSSAFSPESGPPITGDWKGGYNNEQYLSPVGIGISDRPLNLPCHWADFPVRSPIFPIHHLHVTVGVRRDLLVADRSRLLRSRATRFPRTWGAKHRRVVINSNYSSRTTINNCSVISSSN